MGMTPRDTFAVIAGRGAHDLLRTKAQHFKRLGPVPTPFGLSSPLYRVRIGEARFLFLPRHGEADNKIAGPWVNYRANIYALKQHDVWRIMAWSGPAAIDVSLSVGQYVLPHDLIDETRGRESSFYKGTALGVIRQHPVFCPEMREGAERALQMLNLPFEDHGTYLCAQGPRLETPAEIRRSRSWGADLVGLTLVPEAFLSRELEMCYLPICCVAGFAEGVKERQPAPGEVFDGLLEQAEREAIQQAVGRFLDIATYLSRGLPDERNCPCALAMESYRREGLIGEDWRSWIGKP